MLGFDRPGRAASAALDRHRGTPRAFTKGLIVGLTIMVTACGTPIPQWTDRPPTRPPGTAGPAPSATPGPTASPDLWASVELPPLPRVAQLSATRQGVAGAALDTAFTLQSLDGTAAATYAEQVEVEPALSLTVQPSASDPASVTLQPAAPLVPGATYRFALRRVDRTVAATWAVTAARPLRVLGTLPEDSTSEVPVDTGLEITFDQPGVTAADFERSFSIQPAVAGRFEVHGRVIAFVPERLAPKTLYTMRVAAGLPLPGTGQTLGEDVIVRFETAQPGVDPRLSVHIPVKLVDAATAERPVLGLAFFDPDDDDVRLPRQLQVEVHRLTSLAAAIEAYGVILASPDWARTGGAPVRTADLTRILRGDLPVTPDPYDQRSATIRLPQRLPAGWYVATVRMGDLRRQLVFQVTDLSGFVAASRTKTAVWVNDIRTNGPVEGATLRLGPDRLGATDASGLRIVDTPDRIQVPGDDASTLALVVRDGDRSMFVPVDRNAACECVYGFAAEHDAWWQVMAVDRGFVRTTDQINVWGYVRARERGTLPKTLTLSLIAAGDEASLPIVEIHPEQSATGAFSGSLAYRDLPYGDYSIELRADGRSVANASVRVGPIAKPAFTLDLATDRLAILAGDSVRLTAQARFFEGTPVAGVDLRFHDLYEGERLDGTDAEGVAQVSIKPTFDSDDGQWSSTPLFVTPRLPEEADIQASASVLVFRSSAILDSSATIADGRLTVTGRVSDVDLTKYDGVEPPAVDTIDPRGAPRSGARVTITVTEVTTSRTQTGTFYDFITKRTRPQYRYETHRRQIATRATTSATNGTFRLGFDVAGGERGYEIAATYADERGRTIKSDAYAQAGTLVEADETRLESARPRDEAVYSVGDRVEVIFRGGTPEPDVDRYLFFVTHRGLRSAVTSAGPRFATTFTAADAPNLQISGVRFNGSVYEVIATGLWAGLRIEDRALDVTLTTDAERYEPGGRVTVSVRTTDRAGTPVPATVILQTVDEKLYTIGAAVQTETLAELYSWVGSGLTAMHWSHRSPLPPRGFEGGDTTGGGGDREDFRDWLLFEQVTTGADGRATVSFDLSDDLTSWRVTGNAFDGELRAGSGTVRVPVGLQFFVEATIAAEYLTVDRPAIRLRGFGSALRTDQEVAFTISAPTLALSPTVVRAPAYRAAEFALPALTPGDHAIRIAASVGTGAGRLEDVLIRRIRVIDSRSVQRTTISGALEPGFQVTGGAAGTTTLVLSDAGQGRVLPLLWELALQEPDRADRALAGQIARDVLAGTFGLDDQMLAVADADLTRFQTPDGGIALLPYASMDLELSVLAAFARDPRLDASRLQSRITELYDDQGEDRERRLIALAGLAALGQPVATAIHDEAAASDLQPAERAWLSLAALAAGDEVLAGELERALLRAHGQRQGPWVRLDVGDGDARILLTALVALAASGLRDPLAADLDRYLDAHRPVDTLVDLQRALAARWWAERVPGAPAAAALTVDGVDRRVDVGTGSAVTIQLTPAQLATATLERVSGDILVTTSFDAPLVAADLTRPAGVSITRTVTPSGTIAADQAVIVTFEVEVGKDADRGCWNVTDHVPSGLAPYAVSPRWLEEEGDPGSGIVSPWRVVGQRVDFCVGFDPMHGPVRQLRYVARVVTPGTYRWEPAVLQSTVVVDEGIVLRGFDLEVTGEG